MTPTQTELKVDLDVEGFAPSEADYTAIQSEVDRIRPLIEGFPTRILHINMEFNSHSNDYEVKLALVLPGQTFATGDVSDSWEQSLETSTHKMIRRVKHYKASMSGEPEHARAVAGTTMNVEPNRRLDGKKVAQAVADDDYNTFRNAMFPIEASLRDRIGRWVQRYPQIQAMIGSRLAIDDIMEETFMMAFDRYAEWPAELFFGQWIESMIDPAMKAIARDPDGEMEAISFRRTWEDTEVPKEYQ